jgi:hypothetical protein|tara:strand:- start:81 stop:647 length:567 start_codon:yes stop_codon:yes gene_type:complete
MSNFISIYENAIPDELCDRLVEKHLNLQKNSISEPQLGQVTNPHRRDISFFLDLEDEILNEEFMELAIVKLRSYIDEHPSLAPKNLYLKHVKIQETRPKGGFHNFHCERALQHYSLRELVYTVYLNDVVEGEGTTELLEQGVKIQPKRGTMVIFPAAWTHTHRGNPVYSQNKYIATGWISMSEGQEES